MNELMAYAGMIGSSFVCGWCIYKEWSLIKEYRELRNQQMMPLDPSKAAFLAYVRRQVS